MPIPTKTNSRKRKVKAKASALSGVIPMIPRMATRPPSAIPRPAGVIQKKVEKGKPCLLP